MDPMDDAPAPGGSHSLAPPPLSPPAGSAGKHPATAPGPSPSSTASAPGPSAGGTQGVSKRRRGLGVVTPNACTECRKKRAKVRFSLRAQTPHIPALPKKNLKNFKSRFREIGATADNLV